MYERIMIRIPQEDWESNKSRLRKIYELTAGEVEVALLLACGHTLRECAERRGISVTTVRSHLQNIFGKTDTHRQGELVAVLLAGPARVRVECVTDDGSDSSASYVRATPFNAGEVSYALRA